jgi:Flp pilus assembly protein TadG
VRRAGRHLRRFLRASGGGLTVETVLLLPMLFFFYVAAYVWYDAFRSQNLTLKASYTIADMISRETVPVSEAYLNGLNTVFDFMTQSNAPTDVRVTAVKCIADCLDDDLRRLEMCWTWASGTVPVHDEQSFAAVQDTIPLMVLGDTVIITETFLLYEPAFNVLLDTKTLTNRIVTRPRFVPQILLGPQSCY